MRKKEHSVKVPQLYKAASRIIKTIKEEGGSLKDLVFSYNNHLNIKGLYALVLKAFQYEDTVDRLVKKSKILINGERADPWLVRVLIIELLFGRKDLSGNSKPVQTVLLYKEKLYVELEKIRKKGHIQPDTKQRQGSKLRYVRVNTLNITVDEALKYFHNERWKQVHHERAKDYEIFLKNITSLAEDEFTQDFHIKELLIFPNKTEFFGHELYVNGSIILQDKASCLASWLLNPPPGSITLDMCAAPGMKTTHLAALMQNKGVVHAVEMHAKRYQVLKQQVEKCGATCVKTLHMDALCLNASQCPDVQYILVDPSCSGSGMVGRLETENEEKHNASRLEKLAGFQILLLRHALTNFPNVKRVVYSTCSLNIEENEHVVDRVLTYVNNNKSNPTFQIVDRIPVDKWIHHGSTDYEWGQRCLYAQPDVDYTNGFFIAVFERVECTLNEKTVTTHADKKRKRKKTKNLLQESTDIGSKETEEDKNEKNPDLNKSAATCLLTGKRDNSNFNESYDISDESKKEKIKKKRKKAKFRETAEEETIVKVDTTEKVNQEKVTGENYSDSSGNYKTEISKHEFQAIEEENNHNATIKENISEKQKSKKKKKKRKRDKSNSSEYKLDNKVAIKEDHNNINSDKKYDESCCLKGHKNNKNKLETKMYDVEKDRSKKRKQEDCDDSSHSKKQKIQIINEDTLQLKKEGDERIGSKKKKRKKHSKYDLTEG